MLAARLRGALRGTSDLLSDRLRPVRTSGSKLVVLAFHRIESVDAAATELRRLREVAVPVSLDQVLTAQAGDERLPPGSVLVTLDDGHPSVVDAAPVFAELGIPAICFIVSDVIDTDTPFWWDEVIEITSRGVLADRCGERRGMDLVNYLKRVPDSVRRSVLVELRTKVKDAVRVRQLTSNDLAVLESAGIAIGGHSASHPILTNCEDAVLAHELGSCHDRLTGLIGASPRSFAYPGGSLDERVVAAAKRAGWEVAFAWDHRVSAFPLPDLHRISRVKAGLGSGRSRLALLATGRHRSLRSTSPSTVDWTVPGP